MDAHAPSELLLEAWHEVQPLDDATYERAFYGAFVPNSTEYRSAAGVDGPMLYRTRSILQALPRFSSMLSIGTGDGMFDDDLYGAQGLDTFRAIEPNTAHLAKLTKRVETKPNWGNREVIPTYFDQKFDPTLLGEHRFDAALMTHCAYFLKDPVATMEHAQSFLTEEGAVVVLHQSEAQGVCPHFRHFEKRFGLQWDPNAIRQDHAMSTGSLSAALAAKGLSHYVGEEPAQIYVDMFHQADPEKNPKVLDLLSFFMNTNVRSFPAAAISEMIASVRERSELRPSGRYEFDHPQGFIVLPQAGSRTDFSVFNLKKVL